MAKRFLDSEIFKDPWYRKLKPNNKILWIYILCECNHAGIFKYDEELVKFTIGGNYNLDELNNGKMRIIKIKDDKFFVPDFITFQYGELNPHVKLHQSVINILKNEDLWDENTESFKINKNNDPLRVSEQLGRSYLTPKDKDKDKEREKKEAEFKNEVYTFADIYPQEMIDKFFNYWTELTPGKRKMRFELQKTWETKKRLRYWHDNTKSFNKNEGIQLD